jgi:PKD domain-containing protein/fibronectin type III domain protein
MRHTSRSHLRRHVARTVVGTFCAALLPASALAATQASAGVAPGAPSIVAAAKGQTHILGFNHSNLKIKAGRTITDNVVVSPHARRVVLVQAKGPRGSRFVTQTTGHSAANGRFKAAYVATKPGNWQFRLVVPPTRTRKGAVTEPRSVTAVDLTAPGAITQVAAAATTSTVRLSWVNPKDKDFTGVTIRRAEGLVAPTTPAAGDGVTDTGKQATTFTDDGLTVDTDYAYALFAHDKAGNTTRTTITVRTQRDGVTGLEFTAVSRVSVALAWTNPVDDKFTGVVIRRNDGPIAPVDSGDGTFVADVPSPESTFLDTGLTPDTQYTYAVFAHDGNHVALGATLSVTTRRPGTDAVLKVNPLHPTGNNVTANQEIAFDATDSLPADNTTIASWSIDYGDGSTDTFSAGPFDPVDLNASHTYLSAGDKTVTLTVTDSSNNTDTDSVTLHAFNPPQVSVSTGTITPNGDGTSDVTFDIAATTPVGTAITSWQMDVSGDDLFFLPDPGTPAGPPPTSLVVPFVPGTYVIDFEITNDAGASVFATTVNLVVP